MNLIKSISLLRFSKKYPYSYQYEYLQSAVDSVACLEGQGQQRLERYRECLTRIEMQSAKAPLGYRHQRLSNNQFGSQLWSELVLISYQAQWEDRLISDSFLWPRSNSSVFEMKIFALNFLAEHLGQDLNKYESHQTEWPQLDENRQGSEHLIMISLDIAWDCHRIQDKLLWDISNPDNSPEEFAFQMATDLELPSIFNSLIALQIRRQISNYCLKCAQTFKQGHQKKSEFQMSVTYLTIKAKGQEEASRLVPQKRLREEMEQDGVDGINGDSLISEVEKALKGKSYQPGVISQQVTPNKGQFSKIKSATPGKEFQEHIKQNHQKKIKFETQTLAVSGTSKLTSIVSSEQQFTINLRRDDEGLYHMINLSPSKPTTQVIKINLNPNLTDKPATSTSNLIKIPVTIGGGSTEKDLAQSSTHHSNDSSSSKITLDLKNQVSPMVAKQRGFENVKSDSYVLQACGGKVKNNEPTYQSKNHLIQIDLKSLYGGIFNNTSNTANECNLKEDDHAGMNGEYQNCDSMIRIKKVESKDEEMNGHLVEPSRYDDNSQQSIQQL